MTPTKPQPGLITAAFLICLLGTGMPAPADEFHLEDGAVLEGEVLEDLGESYRIRVTFGVVDIEKTRIVKRVRSDPPWRRYEAERKRHADTAEEHYDLAQWCRENGLRTKQLEHLRRVVTLEPDHADARRELGFVRENGTWVKKRVRPPPTPEEIEARRQSREEERLVRKLITGWFVKIKAIHQGRLSGKGRGGRSSKFMKGRRQILAIRDPLALPALTGVLSKGNVRVRQLLVESLSQFDEDEATMNLLVITLMDPSAMIRDLAALALIQREDDRVVERLREALRSDEEGILRNAAAALGTLKARSAVEDLIPVLSTTSRRKVLVARPAYLGTIRTTFIHGTQFTYGGRLLSYYPTSIGVLGSGSMVGTISSYEIQDVSIYRTEVQEALIAITGQNFGFDAGAWRRWRLREGG